MTNERIVTVTDVFSVVKGTARMVFEASKERASTDRREQTKATSRKWWCYTGLPGLPYFLLFSESQTDETATSERPATSAAIHDPLALYAGLDCTSEKSH